MRGQSAFELVMLLIFNILVLFVFLVALQPVRSGIDFERRQVLSREIVMGAAAEIDGAVVMGDGYERSFTLPSRMRDGTNFTLHISPSLQLLTVVWGEGGGSSSQKIMTSQISGNFTHGPHLIRNVGGTVVIGAA